MINIFDSTYYSSIMFIIIISTSLLLMFNLINIIESSINIPSVSLSPESGFQSNNSNFYFLYTLFISLTISIIIAFVIKLTTNKIY